MQIGFGAPVSGAWATPGNLAAFAARAEKAGYATLWSFQRLIVPDGSTMDPVYQDVLDPYAALAYAAAVTRTIRLGVAIVNLPFVSPGYLAKQAASLDVLSAGRHDLGLGIGWMPEEFALTGASMARRGARTAEYIRVLRTLWDDEVSEFSGEFYTVPRGSVQPKPVQPGGPPLILGGMAKPALERIGRLADLQPHRPVPDRRGHRRGEGRRRAGRPRPGEAPVHLPRRGQGRRPGLRPGQPAPAAVRQPPADPRGHRLARRAGRDRGVLRPQLGPADRIPARRQGRGHRPRHRAPGSPGPGAGLASRGQPDPVAVRDRRRLGPAGRTQLRQDVGHVHARGLGGDEQLRGDLPVAAALREQPENLTLPRGQPGQQPRPGRRSVGGRGPLHRPGIEPGTAAQVVERAQQRLGAEAAGHVQGQPPRLLRFLPVAGLGHRLGEPPLGPGPLVHERGAEHLDDLAPGVRVVAALGAQPFGLGPGQPAAALDAENVQRLVPVLGALPGDLDH